ncbi:MAG: hypothetical protein AAGJ35_08265, partial [Myxococcota bacterium]
MNHLFSPMLWVRGCRNQNQIISARVTHAWLCQHKKQNTSLGITLIDEQGGLSKIDLQDTGVEASMLRRFGHQVTALTDGRFVVTGGVSKLFADQVVGARTSRLLSVLSAQANLQQEFDFVKEILLVDPHNTDPKLRVQIIGETQRAFHVAHWNGLQLTLFGGATPQTGIPFETWDIPAAGVLVNTPIEPTTFQGQGDDGEALFANAWGIENATQLYPKPRSASIFDTNTDLLSYPLFVGGIPQQCLAEQKCALAPKASLCDPKSTRNLEQCTNLTQLTFGTSLTRGQHTAYFGDSDDRRDFIKDGKDNFFLLLGGVIGLADSASKLEFFSNPVGLWMRPDAALNVPDGSSETTPFVALQSKYLDLDRDDASDFQRIGHRVFFLYKRTFRSAKWWNFLLVGGKNPENNSFAPPVLITLKSTINANDSNDEIPNNVEFFISRITTQSRSLESSLKQLERAFFAGQVMVDTKTRNDAVFPNSAPAQPITLVLAGGRDQRGTDLSAVRVELRFGNVALTTDEEKRAVRFIDPIDGSSSAMLFLTSPSDSPVLGAGT